MLSFVDHFSEEAIIAELCRARVKLATKRHEAAFLHNIAHTAPPPHQVSPPDWGTIPLDIFPPRRQWHRFRLKRRGTAQPLELCFRALYAAVLTLRNQAPQPAWAQKLQQTVTNIRQRVLSSRPLHFKPPTIVPLSKERGGHLYRPLATYTLEEKIIEGITARYLRTLLDGALTQACLAFRCGKTRRPPPTTHDALAEIVAMQARHAQTGLYVAECDIKGFFDCVGHRMAKEALQRLIADARRREPALRVHSRAIEIFEAYLESYSFLASVRGVAQRTLRQRDPQGTFKWPEEDLYQLYRSSALPSIGVPQGGALSCLIANAVLHQADKAIEALQNATYTPLLYLRYCDDMILISPDRAVCTTAFLAYQRTLRSLRLPVHPAKAVPKYAKSFWDGKSNSPYHWSAASVRWIQFVGYQIRYDGMIRIRPKSLRKQLAAVTDATDHLLSTLQRANRQNCIRRTAREIQHRLRQKLISMSVGRVVLGKHYRGPRPMSWAAGFRGLLGRLICRNHLKVLDRHRERQIQRIKRALSRMVLPAARPRKTATAAHKYYGRPFSYWAQFH